MSRCDGSGKISGCKCCGPGNKCFRGGRVTKYDCPGCEKCKKLHPSATKAINATTCYKCGGLGIVPGDEYWDERQEGWVTACPTCEGTGRKDGTMTVNSDGKEE